MFPTDDPEQLPPEEAIPLLIGLLRAVGAAVEISHSRHGFAVMARLDTATFVVENPGGSAASDLHTALVTLLDATAEFMPS